MFKIFNGGCEMRTCEEEGLALERNMNIYAGNRSHSKRATIIPHNTSYSDCNYFRVPSTPVSLQRLIICLFLNFSYSFFSRFSPLASPLLLPYLFTIFSLVNESQDLTRNVLSSGLLVVHNTSRSGQNNQTELSSRQQVVGPSLDISDFDVESWGNDTTLVQSTGELNDNLSGSVVVDVFELTNVTVLLHHTQEFDDDLGGWSDQDLTLTGLFGVVNSVQSIC